MGDDGTWILSVSKFAGQHDPVGVVFRIASGFSAQQAPRFKGSAFRGFSEQQVAVKLETSLTCFSIPNLERIAAVSMEEKKVTMT
jgi:hypothetical protein